MTNISRDEFEARLKTMDNYMGTFKKETREDFHSVWKAIDAMLIKTGVVVTICTSIVMAIFKYIDLGVN